LRQTNNGVHDVDYGKDKIGHLDFLAFYGKKPKHKHHLILKLGQINSKFQ